MEAKINEDAIETPDQTVNETVDETIDEVDRLESVTPTKARMQAAERAEREDAERGKHHGDPTRGVYNGLDTIAMGGH